jgi:5-methylcytosine-specific restriction endonuclease McrA
MKSKRAELEVVNSQSGKIYKAGEKTKILKRANCLVLNADYRPVSCLPLSVENWKDSITKIFQDKVDVVETYPFVARSPTMEIQVPSVVARKTYSKKKRRVQFTRSNVFLRDNFTCQYCGEKFTSSQLTYDHVIPRSLGGETSFTNIVSSCEKCNSAKKNRPAGQWKSPLGLTRPLNVPIEPSYYMLEDRCKNVPIIIPSLDWTTYMDWKGPIWVREPETNESVQVQGFEEDIGEETSGIYTKS